MRILIPSVVAATILVATSVGWKVEAATMPGVGTLPLQTESYTPVEKVGYYRRHYRRGYYGYRRPYYGYGYYRPYGYYGYGYRPYGYYRRWRY
jgi:hypothetical protein